MKRICRYLPLLVLPFACLPFANAQSGVDVGIGFGAVQDSALSTGLTVDNNPADTTYGNFISCPISNGAAACSPVSSLNSFMMGFSGDLMLWKYLGIGAEVSFQPSKQNYATFGSGTNSAALEDTAFAIQSRVTFYDFNAISQPVKSKRAVLKLEGGIGGANIKYYESTTTSSALVGAQSSSQYFGSSNHFQVHAGVGVQIYFAEHAFLRPQFDIHYVNNLTQFGRSVVTEETVWLGYTFGGQ